MFKAKNGKYTSLFFLSLLMGVLLLPKYSLYQIKSESEPNDSRDF
jgi:hypothetical protein